MRSPWAELVGQLLGVGKARGIVDRDVDVVPPQGPRPPRITEPLAHAVDASELLRVQMQEIARCRPLVAVGGFARLERERRDSPSRRSTW